MTVACCRSMRCRQDRGQGPAGRALLCRPADRPRSRLQAHGISAADIKKLKEGNIFTVEALAHACKKELTAIKGLSEAKVEKMQKEGAVQSPCLYALHAGSSWGGACAAMRVCHLMHRSAAHSCSPVTPCRSLEDRAHGLHHRLDRGRAARRDDPRHYRLQGAG